MATVKQVRERLKNADQDLELMVMIDGQYYDIDFSQIRTIYVKPEEDWAGNECFGIAYEDDEESFKILAIE